MGIFNHCCFYKKMLLWPFLKLLQVVVIHLGTVKKAQKSLQISILVATSPTGLQLAMSKRMG